MQIARGFFPAVVVNQIIPIGDLVVHRTTGVAIGNAAIHAACRLLPGAFVAQRDDEFIVIAHAVGSWRIFPVLPVDFKKACDLAHVYTCAWL